MKTHTRVAVIGGGVVGASVLYHLARGGWTDVVLIERDELTSGSTWHAAGGMHTLNGDPNVAKLQKYTIELYREIEAASGQSCSIHITAGVDLAGTPERMDFLKLACARARYLGLDMEVISIDEAARVFPLMDKRHFVGALYNPLEGHVDPAGVTQAYAKAARNLGAEVYRFTRVTGLRQRADGSWDVITDKGDLVAEHVVNAAGLWAREVGRLVGLNLPVLAMEHQYLVTGEIAEVVASPKEMLHAIDFEGEIYMRQEGKGMLIGTYEKAGVPWAERETPWNFAHELLPPDLDRIAGSLEVGFRHFPALEHAGIKKIVNGPFTFAPDGNPVIGPIRGLRHYWVACGVMAGFSQGGGVGLALSNWMVHHDPGFDVWAMDVARFGDWATMAYTNAKVRENYSRRFSIRFPNEELPAARPLRMTPVYDRLKARGAIFGAAFGLEHALWFAPNGVEAREDVTYRRSNAHGPVGEECRAVRSAVGLSEISSFAKYEVTGPGAGAWLERILANKLPREGRMTLSPMLNENGRLIGDFTVGNAGGNRYFVFGSGIAEQYHMRWFEAHLPPAGVAIRPLRTELLGIGIAGPKSRALLARVCRDDVSNAALPFLSFRALEVAMLPARVGRISFTGELGYEIWVPADCQLALYEALVSAGAELGLAHFGARALNSLRLEKSFGNWAREYRPLYTPGEAGLDRFVNIAKPDFVGRDAVRRDRASGSARRLVTFVVDATDADAIGDEPVWHDGEVVGWITSGGYGHCVGKSIALGYVPSALATAASGFELEILGERRAALLAPEPLLDPQGERMRSG
ncbi:MAG TPA: FAD-dependent oxidoreductase [Casimicrobiaceae bacterium]|jgi:dimethylglycine dehydrogenase|nr:FAD-dependent oxidoreductase [Casimicrobiaceae bacterium]